MIIDEKARCPLDNPSESAANIVDLSVIWRRYALWLFTMSGYPFGLACACLVAFAPHLFSGVSRDHQVISGVAAAFAVLVGGPLNLMLVNHAVRGVLLRSARHAWFEQDHLVVVLLFSGQRHEIPMTDVATGFRIADRYFLPGPGRFTYSLPCAASPTGEVLVTVKGSLRAWATDEKDHASYVTPLDIDGRVPAEPRQREFEFSTSLHQRET